MPVFERIEADDYEQVVYCHHRASGLRSIVSIHSTALGPSLGGTRFYPYVTEDAAFDDVLRLSRGMTYKAALAGLDLGGGKAVIIGDPATAKSETLLRAYARFVDSLGGRYITAEDVGTTQADMDLIRRETRWVTGVSQLLGGSGDPSVATALGLFYAMKAVGQRLWGDGSLEGRHVAISGVGKVGYAVVRHLVEERARVTVADVHAPAVERAVADFGVDAAPVEKIHATECDIYAPCALGGALSEQTIPELRCAAVCGCANNQLATPDCDGLLADAGILYAPDYCVNAGGIINIAEELHGYNRERAEVGLRRIYDTTLAVLDAADQAGITTAAAADRLAEARIEAVGRLNLIRPPTRH
ncbi:MAG: Glu/Leu/Phe/Val family dehydrogenase [Acidimicrobiia bacterium]